MQKSDIDSGMSAIFAASAQDESDKALEFTNTLRENEVRFEVLLTAPNRVQAMTVAEYMAAEDRLAIVTVQGATYIWRPKDPASVDMFFLE